MNQIAFQFLGMEEGIRRYRMHGTIYGKPWTMEVDEEGDVFAHLDELPRPFMVLVDSDMSGPWVAESLANGHKGVGIIAAHAASDILKYLEAYRHFHLLPDDLKPMRKSKKD